MVRQARRVMRKRKSATAVAMVATWETWRWKSSTNRDGESCQPISKGVRTLAESEVSRALPREAWSFRLTQVRATPLDNRQQAPGCLLWHTRHRFVKIASPAFTRELALCRFHWKTLTRVSIRTVSKQKGKPLSSAASASCALESKLLVSVIHLNRMRILIASSPFCCLVRRAGPPDRPEQARWRLIESMQSLPFNS